MKLPQVTVVVTLLILGGALSCSRAPKPPKAAMPPEKFAVVETFYATDRKFMPDAPKSTRFSGERGELQFGIAEVTIPFEHEIGELERPLSPWFVEWFEDPEKHITLKEIKPLEEEAFLANMKASIGKDPEKSVLLFVHGFNVTFEEAAWRTGQLAYDLDFKGAVGFFSWPSNGSVLNYASDVEDINYAQADIKTFLKTVAEDTNAEKIHIIAHSMGSRGVVGALASLAGEMDAADYAKFDQIILTAPDIDAVVFVRDIAPKLLRKDKQATLYASSVDWPIEYSSGKNENQRLGQVVGGLPVLIDGFDSIDSTEVIKSFIGHSYLFDERELITDLQLLLQGMPVDRRPGLKKVDEEDGVFYQFRK